MKVFISGVSSIFSEHRKAAADHLAKHGFDIDEQSGHLADYKTITALLEDKIRSCDAVICLVGPAYGFAPKGQPTDPPCSYTQLEYRTAVALHKKTFIFTPSFQLDLSKVKDTPQQTHWQAAFVQSLYGTERGGDDHRIASYRSREDLLLQIDDVLLRILGERDLVPIEDQYPTPLARLYKDNFHDNLKRDDALAYHQVAWGAMRFLSLLATRDATIHGIFGVDADEAERVVQQFVRTVNLEGWHSLLRLACRAANQSAGSNRFIDGFRGWEESNRETLDKLIRGDRALADHLAPREKHARAMQDIRGSVPTLFASLAFLSRFVLVGIAQVDETTPATFRARLLRGYRPGRVVELRCLADEPSPMAGDVYLLSMDRRQALKLSSVFIYLPAEDESDVLGLEPERGDGTARSIAVTSFVDRRSLPLPEGNGDTFPGAGPMLPRQSDVIAQWLGSSLALRTLGVAHTEPSENPVCRLLDDAAWSAVQNEVLAGEQSNMKFAGPFRLIGERVHAGVVAWEYAAVLAAPIPAETRGAAPSADQQLVHILPEDKASDALLRTWFAQRYEFWRTIDDEHVLRLREESEPNADRPFFATDFLSDAHTLESELMRGGPVSAQRVDAVMTIAARICMKANEAGLYLLALPLRHFLIDQQGRVWFTGFDTAVAGNSGTPSGITPRDYFGRVSKDIQHIDPAIVDGDASPGPLADVYALGALLGELRGVSCSSAATSSYAEDDKWRCLMRHCLARNANGRLQNAAQFLSLLQDWSAPSAWETPATLDVPPGRIPECQADEGQARDVGAFGISKYPITNREYGRFCHETRRRAPHYSSIARLNGPCCPVVGVSLFDGQDYCAWLSDKSRDVKWRLPTEAEWMRAGMLDDDRVYPWGDEHPNRELANFGSEFGGPSVIGSCRRGRSAAGCLDMAGNVWEWTTTFAASDRPTRVQKGGAYYHSSASLRVHAQREALVNEVSGHVGFRVICEERR